MVPTSTTTTAQDTERTLSELQSAPRPLRSRCGRYGSWVVVGVVGVGGRPGAAESTDDSFHLNRLARPPYPQSTAAFAPLKQSRSDRGVVAVASEGMHRAQNLVTGIHGEERL